MTRSWRTVMIALAIVTGIGLAGQTAAAVDVLDPVCVDNPDATACQERQNEGIDSNRIYGPNGIITRVAQLIATIVGVAAVVMIVIAGIQYVLSSGDPSKINNAKDTLLFALVGAVIAASAQAIIVFVLRRI